MGDHSQLDVRPVPGASSGRGGIAPAKAKRGLVLGELLVAFLLLAVAISSLTALMYSVTRQPRVRNNAELVCAEKNGATNAKCDAITRSSNGSRLLQAGCAARRGSKVQECNDSVLNAQASEGTIIRSRTDSAALAMIAKKPKRTKRPDLGFIR